MADSLELTVEQRIAVLAEHLAQAYSHTTLSRLDADDPDEALMHRGAAKNLLPWIEQAAANVDDARLLAETIANARMSTLQAAFRILGWPITFTVVDTSPEEDQSVAASRRRRDSVTDRHLQSVAQVYREAVQEGLPPTKAVAASFEASHSTAARWIGMARSKGHLSATTAGRRDA